MRDRMIRVTGDNGFRVELPVDTFYLPRWSETAHHMQLAVAELQYRHGAKTVRFWLDSESMSPNAIMDTLYPRRYPGSFEPEWKEDRSWNRVVVNDAAIE